MNDLIGIFDSGVGGISVLHTAREILPHEHFLYFGDNGNAPYGPKPVEEIRRLCENAVTRLFERDIKALVIACNTATSVYAEIIRARRTDIPIIGMEPALKPAHFARHGGKILVLATQATLRLEKFQKLKALYGEDAVPVVGNGLVELVESGKAQSPEAEARLRELLKNHIGTPVDCIVLGCTHYPFLGSAIQKLFPNAQLFDGREGTVMQLKHRLEATGFLNTEGIGSVTYETSGSEANLRLMEQLMASL